MNGVSVRSSSHLRLFNLHVLRSPSKFDYDMDARMGGARSNLLDSIGFIKSNGRQTFMSVLCFSILIFFPVVDFLKLA